jgi:hypothetical protein
MPKWVYKGPDVDIRVRVKGRNLHFRNVWIDKDLGRLVVTVDRLPFDEDFSFALTDSEKSGATELYSIQIDPIALDGEFEYYTK